MSIENNDANEYEYELELEHELETERELEHGLESEMTGEYEDGNNNNNQNVRSILKLTNDIVFKAVFARENDAVSRELLIRLLNLILDRKEDAIKSVQYMNPFSINDNIMDKNIIMDIRVATEQNEIIGIEMQVVPYKSYPLRTSYYESKNISAALERGQDYGRMKKTIIISFVEGKLFEDFDKFHSCFKMMEVEEHVQLSQRTDEIHFVEFGKLNFNKPVSELSEVEKYCAFMTQVGKPGTDEFISELLRCDGEGGFIDMTMKALENISGNEKMRSLAMSREMFMLDQMWREEDAREEERQIADEKLKKERMIADEKLKKERAERIAAENRLKKERELAVENMIKLGRKYNVSTESLMSDLIETYKISESEAAAYIERYWK